MKLVTVGASPYHSLPRFLEDLCHAGQPPKEWTLVELNGQLLSLELTLAQRMLAERGVTTAVSGTRSPVAALPGADGVLLADPPGDAGRRAGDLASLATVLKRAQQQEAMADLLATLRAGHVVGSLCRAMQGTCPKATLLLGMPGAAVLSDMANTYFQVHTLGIEAAPQPGLSPQRQQQALERLAAVSLQGLSGTGRTAWEQALEGQHSPLMSIALARLGNAPVQVPSLTFPWGEGVWTLPARVDRRGARPSPPPEPFGEAWMVREETAPLQSALARAAALGDRSALREAVEIHPALYGADRLLVLDLLLSLIDTQPDLLPQFGEES